MMPEEGLKEGIIDNMYSNHSELLAQIRAFAKRFASIGTHRAAIQINKENQFKECLQVIRSTPMFKPETLLAMGNLEEFIQEQIGSYLAKLERQ